MKRFLLLAIPVLVLVIGGLAFLLWQRGTTASVATDSATPAQVAPASAEQTVPPPAEELARPEAEAETARAAAAEAQRELDPEATRWIDVSVTLPEGTPADDATEVVAFATSLEKQWLLINLRGSPAPGASESAAKDASQHDHSDKSESKSVIGRAVVERGGRARLAVPKDKTEVHVIARGRYTYAESTTEVDLSQATPRVALTPELGAWVTGRLTLPADATSEERATEDCELSLGMDPQRALARRGPTGMGDRPERKAEPTADWTFEIVGMLPGEDYILSGTPQRLAAFKLTGVRVAAGQHAVLDYALTRGGVLAGVVVDESGGPIAGAELEARQDAVMFGMGGRKVRKGKSREDGTFDLIAVAAGKLKLDVENDGFLRTTQDFALTEGERVGGLKITLARGNTVAGVVLWTDRTPAAKADVSLTFDAAHLGGMEAFNAMKGAEGKDVTDDAGHFSISGLGDGPFTVTASARAKTEGLGQAPKLRGRADGVKPGAMTIELVLEPQLSVAGRAVDDTGAVITKYTVYAASKGGGMLGMGGTKEVSAVDDEQGRFKVTGLASGSWTLTATGKGYGESAPLEVTLPEAPDAAEIVITIPRAASVRGRVLDPLGAPIAGAKVQQQQGLAALQRMGRGMEQPEAESDAEGRFDLQGLSIGNVTLNATKEGFAPSGGVSVSLAANQVVEDVVLALRNGGLLTGEVLDKQGHPHAAQTVLAQMPDLKYGQRWGNTDASGRFTMEHLAPGTWQVMTLPGANREEEAKPSSSKGDDPGAEMSKMFEDLRLSMAEMKDGEETHVVLGAKAKDPVHVTGQVTVDRRPVASTMITFFPSGGDMKPGTTVGALRFHTTDADGRYSLDLERPGPYSISIQKVDGQGRQQNIEFARTVPETHEHTLDFELPVAGISGRVLDPDGRPAKGVRVSLNTDGPIRSGSLLGTRFSEVATDESGDYSLDWLAPGAYTVSVGGVFLGGMFGGDAPYARQIRSGLEVRKNDWIRNVDFRMSKPCTLTGKVLDAAGATVEGASLFIRDEQGRVLERLSMLVTDSGGRFEYAGLEAGRYTVTARNKLLVTPEARAVDVHEEAKTEIDLRLEPGTLLILSVTGETGDLVEASLSVLDDKGRQVNGLVSLPEIMEAFTQGTLSGKEQRVGPLPAGKYKVIATTPDGQSTSKPVTLSGQSERRLNLKLKE